MLTRLYIVFFRCSRAANSAVCGQIVLNFELIRDILVVFLTGRNEEDPIKKEGANKLIVRFVRHSRAANSEVSGRIPPKFKPTQAFMVVLVTCKNGEDPIKTKVSSVLTRFSPL